MKKDLSTPPKIDKEALDGDGDDEKFSGSWPPKVEFCQFFFSFSTVQYFPRT